MKTLSLALWPLLLCSRPDPRSGDLRDPGQGGRSRSRVVTGMGGRRPSARRYAKSGPRHVLWTTSSAGEWNGMSYGGSKTSGTRHLKIGFKKPLELGSVVVRGGGNPQRAEDRGRGKIDDDAQWIPAQRLRKGRSRRSRNSLVWTLPAVASTQALRFSHTSASYGQGLCGLARGSVRAEGPLWRSRRPGHRDGERQRASRREDHQRPATTTGAPGTNMTESSVWGDEGATRNGCC